MPTNVDVEFYGMARQRAGVESIRVQAGTLREVLRSLGERLPGFAEDCLKDGRLKSGYLANVNGRAFTSDPTTPLSDGDCVLILSTDTGG